MKYIIFIFILLFSTAAQAKPACNKVDYIIGDSIAWMMQRNIGCQVETFYLDAHGARTPSMILNAVVAANKHHRFAGTNVILSSGASNDPGRLWKTPTITELDKIESQLQELKEAEHVILLGVGPGYDDNLKKMNWNVVLPQLAAKYPNVIFMGPLATGVKDPLVRGSYNDPVHPNPLPTQDYPLLFQACLKKLE